MARTVLPIVGAVVGAYFGNPYAGYAIGAAIAGVVDPINTKGPRIGETGAQTSQEGAPRAIVYGVCQVTGNVIASGPLIKRDVKESQGKGGGTSSTEHAYRTFAVRICEGPVAGFLRVWQDDKLVYDVRESSAMLMESAKWFENVVFYDGSESQLPDPSLQMIFGVDEVPAHRGSAYMVKIEEDLTDRRGSIPQFRFEAVSDGQYLAPAATVITGLVGSEPSAFASRSEDAVTFGPLISGAPNGVKLLAGLNRRLIAISTTSSSYSDDYGSTWSTPVSFGGAAWTQGSSILNDLIIVPANKIGTICYRSADNGETYIGIAGVNDTDGRAAINPTRALMLRSSQTVVSMNGGLGWSDAAAVPDTGGATASAIATNGDIFIVGYRSSVTFMPSFWKTVDGFSYTEMPPPASTGSYISAIAFGGDIWVAISDEGSLYYRTDGDDPWNLSPQTIAISDGFANIHWSGQKFVLIIRGALYTSVDGIVWTEQATPIDSYQAAATLARGTPSVIPSVKLLSTIVEDIHARCNFPSGKFDVSELTDLVSGLVLAGDYTGADAINTLRSLYLFDAADQDKGIVYPKRGKAVVATITENDIVEAEESSRREQAIEYPKKLHLGYQNAVGGYAVAKATSARSSPDIRVVGEVSTSVPVVLSPDQAAQAAAIMHKIAWAEAEGETKLSVPLSWIKYIASDCFGVALRGRVTRERLDELNTADGVIEYTMRRDRQSAYTSSVTGIPIPEPTPPPSTIVGETVLAVLDISPRTESEDDLNLLYAVSGGLPAWAGATVQRSLDGGANFASVVDINRGPVVGTLVNPLPDASEFYTDTTNVLRVQLYRDTQTIESITDVQFLSEGGAFAVQRPDGSWEVMQYRDADEVSTGVFDLSYMHRGQLNSGTSAHLAGALFVMLADAVKVPAQSAWIGSELTHRAVSYGESPETADEQTQTFIGRSQLEWNVAYLTLARDGSDNISGSWTPRHRLGTEDMPVASINFRGYRVTLDDGVLPPITFDTTEQSFTRDASALGAPLTVSVAALNRITGAGPSSSESI